MELKFFQFYFRQVLVIGNTYFAENYGMEKKKKKKEECEHYFKTNLLNFIVKVYFELKKKFLANIKDEIIGFPLPPFISTAADAPGTFKCLVTT